MHRIIIPLIIVYLILLYIYTTTPSSLMTSSCIPECFKQYAPNLFPEIAVSNMMMIQGKIKSGIASITSMLPVKQVLVAVPVAVATEPTPPLESSAVVNAVSTPIPSAPAPTDAPMTTDSPAVPTA